MKKRCDWVDEKEEIYIKYHDEEWGVPTYDERLLFEMLVLESFQAGLSWITILKKREAFKKAFDNFDVLKVSKYGEDKVEELLDNAEIIRHEGKIRAAINNANIFIEIQKDYGSFCKYIWKFTDDKIIYGDYKTKSDLSDEISKDLKKKGMKFIGTTIIYSYLESIGVINNHTKECFKYELI